MGGIGGRSSGELAEAGRDAVPSRVPPSGARSAPPHGSSRAERAALPPMSSRAERAARSRGICTRGRESRRSTRASARRFPESPRPEPRRVERGCAGAARRDGSSRQVIRRGGAGDSRRRGDRSAGREERACANVLSLYEPRALEAAAMHPSAAWCAPRTLREPTLRDDASRSNEVQIPRLAALARDDLLGGEW
jgi:hypothetical protein